MRAAFLTEPEPQEAIPVGELPVPVPGLRDVLVAVEVKKVMKPAV
jgi:NADPH:quinone reductase-like Zn-dependent oxidoreductase